MTEKSLLDVPASYDDMPEYDAGFDDFDNDDDLGNEEAI